MIFLIRVAASVASAAPAAQHQQHMVNHDQPCVQSKNAIDTWLTMTNHACS